MRAQLGTPVRSRDDKALGSVEWILVDPETRTVMSIGVRHGWIRSNAIKLPLEEIKISPALDHLIANIDEIDTRHLTHATVSDESELPAGTAVAASAGGGVWPADTFASKRRQTASIPMHSELEEMVRMVDTDVIVLGEGSSVYTKNMNHVGDIEQLRFDTRTGQVLSLEIKGGFLHHLAFELPGEFIAGVDEGSVFLNVDRDEVKRHILEAS